MRHGIFKGFAMTTKVFIDGEAGTTGLQIRARLADHSGVELLSLPDDLRKDTAARRAMFEAADIAVLCLPDAAAREAAAMADGIPHIRLIDASSAHRTHADWVYGFPEYEDAQARRIAEARRVSNPGCYAISSVAILHPLVGAGLVPADWPVTINAVSGYSGGGKGLIRDFEDASSPGYTKANYQHYALRLDHKHVPEIQARGGLTRRPLMSPGVGRFRQGMVVQVPLQLWALPGQPKPADIHRALAEHYRGKAQVIVAEPAETAAIDRLDPEVLVGRDEMRLHVFGNEAHGQAVVACVLDNLGKGASGQAVQNLDLMCGLDAAT